MLAQQEHEESALVQAQRLLRLWTLTLKLTLQLLMLDQSTVYLWAPEVSLFP